jgi:hypothetical protein
MSHGNTDGATASGLGSVRSVSGPTRLRVVSLSLDGPRQGARQKTGRSIVIARR